MSSFPPPSDSGTQDSYLWLQHPLWLQSHLVGWGRGTGKGAPDFKNPGLEETHTISAAILLVRMSQHTRI